MELLAPDVVLISDGGGVRRAALRPVEGRDKVLRFAVGVLGQDETAELSVDELQVNGQPAIGLYAADPDGGRLLDSVIVLVLDGGVVSTVLLIRNPDKLAGAGG